MSDENGSGQVLDPELIEEIDEYDSEAELLGAYTVGGEGAEDRQDIHVLQQWFPGPDEWQGKTNIHPEQAVALAALRHLPDVFPEFDEPRVRRFIIGLVEDYEKYLTSIDGKAREEQERILQSMFGGGVDQDGDGHQIKQYFAAEED